MSVRKKLAEPVPWTIFVWAVGICSALFIAMFSDHASIRNQIEIMEARNEEIRVQLSQIQADIKNLDFRLIEIRQDIKEHVAK